MLIKFQKTELAILLVIILSHGSLITQSTIAKNLAYLLRISLWIFIIQGIISLKQKKLSYLSIHGGHITQLSRYLANEFGKFGILVTRNELSRAMYRNTIDLWSGQRRCIIALTDADLKLMVNIYETKQRLPIEVIKKRYIEFTRACPV